MLPDLPKVSSLQIVTGECSIGLPVTYSQHITHLELGLGVYFDDLPPSLCSLAVQTLGTRCQGCVQILTKLSQAVVLISNTVQECESADLSGFDPNMQEFRLQMPLIDIKDLEHSRTWHSGLARLINLRVLCDLDFLTEAAAVKICCALGPDPFP